MSVLIISRSQDKLERVRAEIRERSAPGAEVEILAHDFTQGGAEADAFYARLATVAAGLDCKGGVGMLINNVGVNVEVPEFFQDLAEGQIQDIVRVNVESTVRMTRTILPLMVKRCVSVIYLSARACVCVHVSKRAAGVQASPHALPLSLSSVHGRRSGGVINISSGSGNHPTPLLSTYAATKAFINEFSRSLHYEARAHGVDVLVVTPYYVTSNMYKKPPGVLNCSAERFVQDTLPLLGRYDIAYPYVAHAILGNLMRTYWATPQVRRARPRRRTRQRQRRGVGHDSMRCGSISQSINQSINQSIRE